MAGADALRMVGPLAGSDELGQAVIANLDDSFLHEKIGRLQVAVNDPVVVQVGHAINQAFEPVADLGQRQPGGVLLEDAGQARPRDVLHYDKRVAGVAGLHVEDGQQVRAFQVHTLHDPAPLDVEIAKDQLEGNFLTGIGGAVIDLAEAAAANGSFDRVTVQRPCPRTEGVAALSLGCRVGFGHV